MIRSIPMLTALCLIAAIAVPAASQPAPPSSTWVDTLAEKYAVFPDVTYGVANNYALKLDVWQRKDARGPAPTLIYYHGGGWIFGDRTGATLQLLPYLEMGWNVVNVEYRMASVSRAPAAVEDCRCALHWVVRNAKQYNVDIQRIVLTGHSAGGHLSLIVGMLPNGTGLDSECYGDDVGADRKLNVAAIINWFGIADVNDLIQGPNVKNYAVMWMGSQTDAVAIAKRVSPLTYVRSGLPPVLSIHGDQDAVVPYEQSVRLHQALTAAGVPNQLITIKGGGHGQFSDNQLEEAYGKVRGFLREHGLQP
jgi:acetyl esterase/lipase